MILRDHVISCHVMLLYQSRICFAYGSASKAQIVSHKIRIKTVELPVLQRYVFLRILNFHYFIIDVSLNSSLPLIIFTDFYPVFIGISR